MSEPSGLFAEQEAFNTVGSILFGLLVDGDERIEYRSSMTVAGVASKVMAFNPAGRLEAPSGRYNTPDTPYALDRAFKVLRQACYRPGAGTWFSVLVVVQASGAASVEYNYDREVDFSLGGIDPISYVTDQEKFPRNVDQQPEWLKLRLAEGRARLAARDK
ncbi:hypothetical protein [Cryobacterium luteum]|uniref:DUF600 family protein n=1 Tax=Cryobacterium luteum TaxID=1424661 RepID=A0A1H8ADF2_9MICO|nr:hypothetical protein [Cryobacterium luteum]TFB88479.1 hypothetical protein E3O10_11775 [Cryobacterium luteum]SEM68583.1 hypothetical protein SAMN05216281_101135 [Cryobacterium luteum]